MPVTNPAPAHHLPRGPSETTFGKEAAPAVAELRWGSLANASRLTGCTSAAAGLHSEAQAVGHQAASPARTLLWSLREYEAAALETQQHTPQHPALQGALAGLQAPQLVQAPAQPGSALACSSKRGRASSRSGAWPHPGLALKRISGVGQQRGSVQAPNPDPSPRAFHAPRRPRHLVAAGGAARAVRGAAASTPAPSLPPGALPPRPRKLRSGLVLLDAAQYYGVSHRWRLVRCSALLYFRGAFDSQISR